MNQSSGSAEDLSGKQAGGLPDTPPPFLGTWRRVYAAVLVYLLTLIALFSLFTCHYRVPS